MWKVCSYKTLSSACPCEFLFWLINGKLTINVEFFTNFKHIRIVPAKNLIYRKSLYLFQPVWLHGWLVDCCVKHISFFMVQVSRPNKRSPVLSSKLDWMLFTFVMCIKEQERHISAMSSITYKRFFLLPVGVELPNHGWTTMHAIAIGVTRCLHSWCLFKLLFNLW